MARRVRLLLAVGTAEEWMGGAGKECASPEMLAQAPRERSQGWGKPRSRRGVNRFDGLLWMYRIRASR